MEDTESISQGVFRFLPSKKQARKRTKDDMKANLKEQFKGRKIIEVPESTFRNVWNGVEKEIKEMNKRLYSKVLEDLVEHIGTINKCHDSSAIPCELLLTGANISDHQLLLESLTQDLRKRITCSVAVLWGCQVSSLKTAMQTLVKQIVNLNTSNENDEGMSEDSDEDDVPGNTRDVLKKQQLTWHTLEAWYAEKTSSAPIVVIVPDFESFNATTLGDLIIFLRESKKQIPFIFVLCVATSPSVVSQGLPRVAFSQLVVKVFRSEPSRTFLNHVIEEVLLSDKCPFRLGRKTMTFLTDVFLFHSFSVQRFLQGFKLCMVEHYFKKNHMSLCCSENELHVVLENIPAESVEKLRRLSSFQRHVEGCDLSERRKLLLDDDYTKVFVAEKLRNLHKHISDFHCALKCLNILSRDLPGAPLGKHLREIYCRAVSSKITKEEDYKQTMALLSMQSFGELFSKVNSILDLLKMNNSSEKNIYEKAIRKLEKIQGGIELSASESNGKSDVKQAMINTIKNLLESFLVPPTTFTFHEVLYFDDLPAVRERICGSSIQTALDDPHQYLECDCCELTEENTLPPTLPDLSIVYKLYLESGKTIKVADWMQSFAAVVRPDEGLLDGEIDPKIKARFDKAVSELHLLGYVKPNRSSSKVTRLILGKF